MRTGLAMLMLAALPSLAFTQVIKVGYFHNPPLSLNTGKGSVSGLFPDLLEEIAKKEGWNIRWVQGSWAQCLERLEKGELDLMISIVPNEERELVFSFNEMPVIRTWAQVFAPPGNTVRGVMDLRGLRVTVMERDISGKAAEELIASFGIEAEIIKKDLLIDAFEAVSKGEADVVVSNNVNGTKFSHQYSLKGTPIIFNPIEAQFAAPIGKNLILLNKIDEYLRKWVNKEGSPFVALQDKWLAPLPEEKSFPYWIFLSLMGAVFAFFLWNRSLGQQVERKTHELAEEQKKLVSAQKLSKLGDFSWNIKTGDVRWSDGMYHLLGYDRNDEINFDLVKDRVHHPDDNEMVSVWIQDAISKQKLQLEPMAYRLIKKDGTSFHVLTHGDLSYENGEATMLFGTCQDISSKLNSEILLADSQAHWRTICENAPGFLITLNKDLEILFINTTLEGIAKEDVIGLPLYTLAPEEMQEHVKSILLQVLDSSKSIRYETYFDHSNGDRYFFESDAVYINTPTPDGAQLMVISQDITERKRSENSLLKAKSAAENANSAKSTFLANMSHELRTPMNAMLGLAQLLKETKLENDQEEMVERISKCGSSLTGILSDILDLASIEAGKVHLKTFEFCFKDVFSEIESLFGPEASKKGIKLEIESTETLLTTQLKGDPLRLKQVLTNLVGNAIKFTSEGSVRLLGSEKTVDNTLLTEFKVIDTGIGIESSRQSEIFKSFEQADSKTTREYGGTGLGLAIVKNIVGLMGGSIELESELGRGSTFTLSLGFPKVEEQIDSSETEAVSSDNADLLDLRVLLAEDDEDCRFLMDRILGKAVKSYSIARDGLEVIDLLEKEDFDLILMDVSMPQQDGLETTRVIREGKRLPNIRIIALTAHALPEDRKRCLDAGMDDQLTKPIRVDRLKSCLMENAKILKG